MVVLLSTGDHQTGAAYMQDKCMFNNAYGMLKLDMELEDDIEFLKNFNKAMERRTDFEMKATEPAEVVDVVGDDCEEVGCEESDGDAGFDGFVTAGEFVGLVGAAAFVVVDVSVVEFGFAFWPLTAKTATTNSSRQRERRILMIIKD
ncbi:unnamed protein product [Hymenolepis diminuta]|uniref:Uncharacterized protein n=1 Tax=Hymenolepis diminuta TaxID=6216 RepID=A0A564Z789_HYMDI|nr:unnamed protein product [Hymenolepis diminuta]